MIFKDYYKILDLETSRVSINDIKIAYRAAAKKYHPDVNIGDRLAEDKIKDINEAYKILSNPSSKRKYDRSWNAHIGKKLYSQQNRKGKTSMFNMFFGETIEKEEKDDKKIPVRGEDVETEINVSIEEAFFGLEKKIALRTVDGKMKSFVVTVPSGIRNKEKIRLIGQGKEGKNGGKNGDLFIKINIENNNKFKINGNDLCTDLFLTPWEAALGTRVEVQSIDDTAKVYVPQGIQSGEKIRIAGKGYKTNNGRRGDLVAEVKIMVPKQATEDERKIFEKLNEISSFNPRKII